MPGGPGPPAGSVMIDPSRFPDTEDVPDGVEGRVRSRRGDGGASPPAAPGKRGGGGGGR